MVPLDPGIPRFKPYPKIPYPFVSTADYMALVLKD